MTIETQIIKNITRRVILGKDYRIEVVNLINAQFLDFSLDFFRKIVDAKLRNKDITIDWYKKEFLNTNLQSRDIATNAGLNMKTIHNMFNSSTKEIVIDASNNHYDLLRKTIKDLVDSDDEIDLVLTIKIKSVSVDLNINESLLVINALAVKRAALRGGFWSAAGKRVEKPLMQALCGLHDVENDNYAIKIDDKPIQENDFQREIDFYLIEGSKQHKCEVKLMGKGNPEGADVVIARSSRVFVADKLSDGNKQQLNKSGVEWVELRSDNGIQKFGEVLDHLKIPHTKPQNNMEQKLEEVLGVIFQ